MKVIINNSFIKINKVANWWENVIDVVQSWESFEKKFTEKFWDKTRQTKILKDLHSGKFNKEGSLTLSEYLLAKVNVVRYLNPLLSDQYIFDCIKEHFEVGINEALLIRGNLILKG